MHMKIINQIKKIMFIQMISLVIFILFGVTLQNVASVTVWTEQGLLKGEELWTITGDTLYNSFKGIPYAAPPIGNLRFKNPQPPLSWKGTRNATAHGNVCPQFDRFANKYIPGSEDCLYLNVYTPSLNPESLLPVMFYIHGGGYEFGSGNDDNFGPDFLVNYNIVLVTINYRLDSLGFLCLDSEEVPGNAGLKDQVAALKWVKSNIRNFGGDPNKVTIFGQSAGGSSVTLHAMSPMSKDLFHRVIAISGVPISEFSIEFEPKRRALVLSKSLGLDTRNITTLHQHLLNVPFRKLIRNNVSVIVAEEIINHAFKPYFVPVIEKDFGQERFLIEPPSVSVQNGRIHDVDIILGYTNAEAITLIDTYLNSMIINYSRYQEALVPRHIFYQTPPRSVLKLSDMIKDTYFGSNEISWETLPQSVQYITDVFIFDVIRYARHLSKFNKNYNIYLYEFSGVSERNVYAKQGAKYGLTGAAHCDDLMYLFNANRFNVPIDKNSTSYRMIQQTCTLFTNFAKFGNPTPDLSLGVNWPQYNATSQVYLDIGEKLTVGADPKSSMIKFWEHIFHQAGLPF